MSSAETRRLLANGQLKKLARQGDAALPVVRAALWDSDWRARRNALRVLDHSTVGDLAHRMVELLRDDHDEVRKWAAHALGCERCKAGGELSVDPVPYLFESAESDPSVEVRRSAVVCLAWNRPVDPRIGEFLARLARRTDDPKIRRHARDGVIRHSALSDDSARCPRLKNSGPRTRAVLVGCALLTVLGACLRPSNLDVSSLSFPTGVADERPAVDLKRATPPLHLRSLPPLTSNYIVRVPPSDGWMCGGMIPIPGESQSHPASAISHGPVPGSREDWDARRAVDFSKLLEDSGSDVDDWKRSEWIAE